MKRERESCIVYVLRREHERMTYFCQKPFVKVTFDTKEFLTAHPISNSLQKYDIDDNAIWGQLSAHFRIIAQPMHHDVVGFGQYRRTFKSKSLLRRLLRLPMSQKEILAALSTKEAIVTSYHISEGYTAFENFERYRGGVDDIIRILLGLYPHFKDDIDIMRKKPGAFWNGPNIIAKRDYLLRYYRVLIPFLKECYHFYKTTSQIKNRTRYLDYCGELFFAVYHHRQMRLHDNLSQKAYVQYRDYLKTFKNLFARLFR